METTNASDATAEGQEVLLALQREAEDYRVRRKWRFGLTISLVALCIVCVMFGVKAGLWGNLMVAAIGCLGWVTESHRWAMKKAVRNLDKRTAPYLLEALLIPEPDTRKAARWGLAGTLPLVTREDDALFDAHQRHILYGQLGPLKTSRWLCENEVWFVAAVLHAIHMTGGSEAIPFLEDFARRAGKRRGPWRKLAEQAVAALPDLRIRAAKAIVERKVEEVKVEQERQRLQIAALKATPSALPSEEAEPAPSSLGLGQ